MDAVDIEAGEKADAGLGGGTGGAADGVGADHGAVGGGVEGDGLGQRLLLGGGRGDPIHEARHGDGAIGVEE